MSWDGGGGRSEITLADPQLLVRTERLGDRTATIPLAPLPLSRYAHVSGGYKDAFFDVRDGADTTAPELVRVGAPRARHNPAFARCHATHCTVFRVDVTDESPVVFAVWGGSKGEPDLHAPSRAYARLENREIAIESDYPYERLPAGPGQWAFMAVDAAGNTSHVVHSPSK